MINEEMKEKKLTPEEVIKVFESELEWAELNMYPYVSKQKIEADKMAIKALEQEPCEDCISRKDTLKKFKQIYFDNDTVIRCAELILGSMPPVTPQPKIGHCRECKWWKDSDGVFRRGIDAESQCPMNRIEVYEGDGYCYMFKPQESEE